jgi:hypothetical protein
MKIKTRHLTIRFTSASRDRSLNGASTLAGTALGAVRSCGGSTLVRACLTGGAA